MRLRGKVAIITGAGSGMGRAGCLRFAQEGAKVVAGDLNVQTGEETVRMIKKAGGDATFVRVDVSKAAEVQKMVDAAVKAYGGLHVLYNNAGILAAGDDYVADLDEAVWDRVMGINLKGVFLGCKYGVPAIIKSGGGSIINTASIAGVSAGGMTAYGTSKGGVLSLTRYVARQYADKNVRCNAILPGPVVTNLQAERAAAGAPASPRPKLLQPDPFLKRSAQPAEIINLAVFLASDESSYMTGASVAIDGGVTAV